VLALRPARPDDGAAVAARSPGGFRDGLLMDRVVCQ
jgi:hypothetical protein